MLPEFKSFMCSILKSSKESSVLMEIMFTNCTSGTHLIPINNVENLITDTSLLYLLQLKEGVILSKMLVIKQQQEKCLFLSIALNQGTLKQKLIWSRLNNQETIQINCSLV